MAAIAIPIISQYLDLKLVQSDIFNFFLALIIQLHLADQIGIIKYLVIFYCFNTILEDCGNIICLSLTGDTAGKVYYWDHDGETDPPTFDNVYKIADSFQGFLDSIHFFDVSTL